MTEWLHAAFRLYSLYSRTAIIKTGRHERMSGIFLLKEKKPNFGICILGVHFHEKQSMQSFGFFVYTHTQHTHTWKANSRRAETGFICQKATEKEDRTQALFSGLEN